MNMAYGRLVDGPLVYAPDTLEGDGAVKVNPSRESYLEAGWKEVVDEPPAPKEGYEARPSGWKEDGDVIRRVYKMVRRRAAKPPKARVFSKLKVVAALKEIGKWVLVKTWMEEYAYYDYYLAAQDFSEDNEKFGYAVGQLKELFGWSDDDLAAFLDKCVLED